MLGGLPPHPPPNVYNYDLGRGGVVPPPPIYQKKVTSNDQSVNPGLAFQFPFSKDYFTLPLITTSENSPY